MSHIDDLKFRYKAPLPWTADNVTASISETRIAERFIAKLDINLDVAERMLPAMAQAVVKDALQRTADRLGYELQGPIAAAVDKELRDREWVRGLITQEVQRFTREWMSMILADPETPREP